MRRRTRWGSSSVKPSIDDDRSNMNRAAGVSVRRTPSGQRLAFLHESQTAERVPFEEAADVVALAGRLPLDGGEFQEAMLWFDHNGYCILYKRLHRAHFELPDASEVHRPLAVIDARALGALLRGVEKRPA